MRFRAILFYLNGRLFDSKSRGKKNLKIKLKNFLVFGVVNKIFKNLAFGVPTKFPKGFHGVLIKFP